MEGKGVYTIERLPEVKPGEVRRSKVGTLAAALLLATAIVLAVTAALVYALRAAHREYRPTPAASSSWAAEMMVSGEFRITNEPFRNSLYNLSSPDFKQLASRIEKELALLYQESGLEVQSVAVTSLGPGLQVRCSLALRPRDNITIGKIGLAFLAGLNHTRGHLSLGPFYVDVLSIGFQARTEEVSWSQWSDWSECVLSEKAELVRQRRRVCLSQDGLKLRRSEPCEAVGGRDGESLPCPPSTDQPPARTQAPPVTSPATPPTTSRATPPATSQPTTPVTSRATASAAPRKIPPWVAMLTREATLSTTQASSTTTQTAAPTTQPPPAPTVREENSPSTQTTTTTTTTTQMPERIGCSVCGEKEVCVALEGDSVPLCRPVLDPADPTGCGGLCKIDSEVCHRLGQGAYRCLDDSKCLDNEWQCGNALCIPLIKRCDGHFNCYDHTDEHNCDCDLKTHFQCGKNLSCLPQSKRCDGVVDCWDAADESNCTIACLDETQFTCNDSQCIPSKNFCDGFVDCKDHSDEPFGCGGVCKNHEWRCRNGRCIVKRDVCNGQDDCGDFSDEIKCGKRRGAKILS